MPLIPSAARAVRGLLAGFLLVLLLGGLPWALGHYIGWPLPEGVPTGDELSAVLLNPMSTRLLLDVLACLCWITWSMFVVDVIRCTAEAIRGIAATNSRPGGAIHRTAAVLIGTVVITILGRGVAAALPSGASSARGETVTSSSVLRPGAEAAAYVTEVVRTPENGTHDSLWRVAERIWGDGARWPELFEQNRGVPQFDGNALLDPNHVRPGWTLTALVPAPSPSPPPPPPPAPPPPDDAPAPVEPDPAPPAPENHQAGLDLVTGAFVSLGLAGTIATAVAIVRNRRRRRYRIGSGDRADLERPLAPVVRALVIAAQPQPNSGAELPQDDPQETTQKTPVGVRDGREHVLTLAATGGLGLTGPGGTAAVRALLMHLLAAHHEQRVRLVVPQHDLSALLGAAGGPHPTAITVTDSLDAALNELDTELITRTRELEQPDSDLGTLVLIATPTTHDEHRLQAVLRNGSHLGLTAVLIGSWPPGTTMNCRQDGTVDAVTPDRGHDFVGTRLFTLPSTDTADLLALLHDLEEPAEDAPRPADAASATHLEVIEEPAELTAPPDVPPNPKAPLDLHVLGRLRLLRAHEDAADDLIQSLAPKQRELLVRLAIQPEGVRRETIAADIWPEAPGRRPYNTFHATLSQLRRALRTATAGTIQDLTNVQDGHYALDPAVVDVDLWRLNRILGTRTPHIATIDDIIELYRGDLADSLGSEWLLAPREALRRDVLDALRALNTGLRDTPERQLEALEHMRRIDPHNESIYRDIMRIQGRLDRVDAVPRTMALLAAMLEEIGERPERETIDLAGRIKMQR